MKCIEKECEGCGVMIQQRIVSNINSPNYGKPYVQDSKKRFCSLICLNEW